VELVHGSLSLPIFLSCHVVLRRLVPSSPSLLSSSRCFLPSSFTKWSFQFPPASSFAIQSFSSFFLSHPSPPLSPSFENLRCHSPKKVPIPAVIFFPYVLSCGFFFPPPVLLFPVSPDYKVVFGSIFCVSCVTECPSPFFILGWLVRGPKEKLVIGALPRSSVG